MSSQPRFSCPLCTQQLAVKEQNNSKSLVCENNHCFDYAKEGYVNLLPVQMKKSLQPGDDKNMVIARREFLQLGHYDFMRDDLARVVNNKVSEFQESAPDSSLQIIDLGCGEGFYTNFIASSLDLSQMHVYGIDISKPAVKYAAKRSTGVYYAVGTNAHLPFSDKSIDLIFNVFAPLIGKECKRLLTQQGAIISVAPGPEHLYEIKQFIYSNPEKHALPQPPEGFEEVNNWPVRDVVEINSSQQLSYLLTMTPFGWKTSEQDLAKMINALPLKVTLDFIISEFKQNTDRENPSARSTTDLK